MNRRETKIAVIDKAIDDLKKLSIPRGYSDPSFALMLSSYYTIKSNLQQYSNEDLLLTTLSCMLFRIEVQHILLCREEKTWKEEYNNALFVKYNKWLDDWKRRREFKKLVKLSIQHIELLVDFNKETLFIGGTGAIEIIVYFSKPLSEYTSYKDSNLPPLLMRTVIPTPANTKGAIFFVDEDIFDAILDEILDSNFEKMAVYVDDINSIDRCFKDWLFQNSNNLDEEIFVVTL